MSESDTDKPAAAEADSEDVDRQMEEIEKDPPQKLDDWPGGKAKYRTFGGGDGDEGYGEGPTEKLGPADLVHKPDGSVTIGGEKVDNPEDYKGDPIPGGPTDPNAPPDPGFDDPEAKEDGDDAEASGDDE